MTATGVNYEDWSKRATIKVWQAVFMMHEYDPRVRDKGYVPMNSDGDAMDLADDMSLLESAALAGEIEAITSGAPVGPETHLRRKSLAAWASVMGYTKMAEGLGLEVTALAGAGAAEDDAAEQLRSKRTAAKARPGWRDTECWDHAVAKHREGRFATCKELYEALFKEAGSPDSPFEQGTNSNRGQLVMKRLRKPVALPTMQNAWGELNAAANKRS